VTAAEPKPLCERIGQRVRERREGLRLSRARLGAMTELSRVALWQIEQGQSEPMASTILRLCRVLGCSADWLLGVNEETP